MTAALDLKEAIDAFQRGELDRARTIAERALAAEPSPQVQHLLGLIQCRQGDPATGVEHLRAAADAEPGNAAFNVMLIRALVDSGRADEVLAMPEPPPIRSASDLALWQARAEAADATGRPDLASDSWSKITAATPRDWRAWGNLGNAFRAQKKWGEAAGALYEAARLNPSEPAIRDDAVAMLLQVGQQNQLFLNFDEAENAFRGAYELAPTNDSVVYHLGVALERTNRLEALAKLLDDSLVAGISSERLAYLLAALARRQGRLEDARKLLESADPGDDPVAWNSLKAKVADELGDSEAAFEAAAAMNQAAVDRTLGTKTREEWERGAQEYRDKQRRLAPTISPEWASRVPLLTDPPTQRLAFLLGFPRSGTTLLDTFLLGHPDIKVLEEVQLVGAARQLTGPIEDLPGVTIETLKQARDTYLERLSEHFGPEVGGVIVDKFPLDMGYAPLIQAMFPGQPMIFAQRHPCDVVLSGFMQPIGLVNFFNIEAAADYYDAMMSIWTASRDAMDLNVHVVVYEELVRDPEAVLRPLLGFLGLEWDERVLDHQRTARERGTIVTPTYDQVTEPITTRASGRWKRYRKQLEPVLPVLLPWAERLGYTD